MYWKDMLLHLISPIVSLSIHEVDQIPLIASMIAKLSLSATIFLSPLSKATQMALSKELASVCKTEVEDCSLQKKKNIGYGIQGYF